MTFLDNFSFAFQDIELISKWYKLWKYWENIHDKNLDIVTSFKWVIQKKKDFIDWYLDKNNLFKFTSMDFSLRCPNNILAAVWDVIKSNNLEYEVVYVYPPVMIEWVHDHNLYVIRFNN